MPVSSEEVMFRHQEPYRFTHEKWDRLSYLQTPCTLPPGPSVPGYTTPMKSQSFHLAAQEPKTPLSPLADGRPATLLMNLPQSTAVKKIAAGRPIPVVIVPGSIIGASDDSFLVSVIGKGSALIAPIRSSSISELVTAGIPARLAKVLHGELRNITWRKTCHL
jgi:hypothetical protein